jgi:small multidrug resistance pump
MMTYVYLSLAILTEVTATLLLKASNGWEKWWFGMGAIFFYCIAGMILAFVLKSMNVGLAYTIWSGAGIALVCVASILLWQQKFDIYALAGVLLIVVGTGLITLKSSVVIQ